MMQEIVDYAFRERRDKRLRGRVVRTLNSSRKCCLGVGQAIRGSKGGCNSRPRCKPPWHFRAWHLRRNAPRLCNSRITVCPATPLGCELLCPSQQTTTSSSASFQRRPKGITFFSRYTIRNPEAKHLVQGFIKDSTPRLTSFTKTSSGGTTKEIIPVSGLQIAIDKKAGGSYFAWNRCLGSVTIQLSSGGRN